MAGWKVSAPYAPASPICHAIVTELSHTAYSKMRASSRNCHMAMRPVIAHGNVTRAASEYFQVMKTQSLTRRLLPLAAFGSLLTALAPTVLAQGTVIKIDGSSTVFPVTEAVAEEFQNEMKGKVKVTVGISGTGGGFKKFARGEPDIADASRPILKAEMEACRAAGIEYHRTADLLRRAHCRGESEECLAEGDHRARS